MLIDTQYLEHTKKLICSYVDTEGSIKLKYYDWQTPFKYEVCDPTDPNCISELKSWDKKPIKKVEVTHPDRYAIYEFLDALPQEEKDIIFGYQEPKIYFLDIETEVIDGFPNPKDAPTQVQSISVVYDDKVILLGLKDMPEDMRVRIEDKTNEYFKKYDIKYKLKYIKYDEEFDMLYHFFHNMVPKMSCITGWNFINFDWTFLINRARKLTKEVNGKVYSIDPRESSFTKRLNKIWMTDYEIPCHRMIFDYMQLYEICDNSIKVKESSSLDFVSDKLIGVSKIKYSGSLMKLYEEDFETFMYYNAVDSVLVKAIHDKTNFISIIYAISCLAQIRVTDVISQLNNALGSLAITEGVLRNKFREQDGIILFRDATKNNTGSSTIAGGWVKDPAVGMNRWVAVYDFSSLYPTSQRQFYIAPENFVGIQLDTDKEYCMDGSKRVKIDKEKMVVCVNGTVFLKRKSPTIQMLEEVFADRKKSKKIMLQKKSEYSETLDEIKQLEKMLEEMKS